MSREHWGSRLSFVLACIGAAVGLGNIWRFPYLCYKSGGGAFLVPYILMLVLCGLPLLYMELAVGQYTRRGPIQALAHICPILKGAGLATVMISFWLCTYYNVIISWAMFYLFSSFQSPLPWTHCNNSWNTDQCWDVNDQIKNGTSANERSSTQEFYAYKVLNMSDGIEDMGGVKWDLLGLLVLAWIMIYFCIWKSIKTTGKVVYFTATIPYLMLFVFLIRGVTLPGAGDGLNFLFTPKWEKMLDAKVWVYAAAQVFNSIGIAFGSLVAYSSYNKFNGPILRDTFIITIVDAVTCLICGVCVFSTLGNLAFEQGKSVDDVVTQGPGLVFIVFPHALSKLAVPQFWSVVFFGMLIMLGVDSQFATVEVIVTSLKDGFGPWIDKYIKRHEFLVALVCFWSFLFGVPYVFRGGVYYFTLVDYYAAAISLMYIAFFECIAIVWCYGAYRLAYNVKDMTGSFPSLFFRLSWLVSCPLIILAIWISSIVDYEEPTYGKYVYPKWAIGLGWFIAATSLGAIPGLAVVEVVTNTASDIFSKLKSAFTSPITHCPCGCGQALDEHHQAHGPTSQVEGTFRHIDTKETFGDEKSP